MPWLLEKTRNVYKRLSTTRRLTSIEEKNSKLNRNLKAYSLSHRGIELPDRETDISPEVLVPCYNQGRYLSEALASIKMNGVDVDVTIINDASTDDTARFIQRLSSDYKFNLITNAENLNQSGSLNRAIEQSANNFFIVLNADDCLLPYCIDTVLRLASRHESVRLIGGGNIPFSSDAMIKLARNFPRKLDYETELRIYDRDEAMAVRSPNDIDMTMSSCAFFKTAWKQVGGFFPFEKRVCSFDDRDFQLRVASLFDIGVVEEPLALWRTDSSLGLGQQ